MPRIDLVVPCYDEEKRLAPAVWSALGAQPGVRLWMVDDGSRDGTRAVLDAIAATSPDTIRTLAMPRNGGKAEAVRAGLLAALADGADIVGFLDADLSTSGEEMLAIARVLVDRADVDVVLGARVLMLGRAIDRSRNRHYIGRVFATAASAALGLPVYDTQCGAKAFRRTPPLLRALSTPFRSRWAFDVELLSRLLRGGGGVAGLDPARVIEVPLTAWRDVKGSKVTWQGGLRALVDLWSIAREHRRGTS